MSEILELEQEGWQVRVAYDAIPDLIRELNRERLEYHSRALLGQVEPILEGSPITVNYVVDWPDSRMVGIGLNVPGHKDVIFCQLEPGAAIEWVKTWVASVTKERGNASSSQAMDPEKPGLGGGSGDDHPGRGPESRGSEGPERRRGARGTP